MPRFALLLLAAAILPATALAQGAPRPPAPAAICGTCHAWQGRANRVGPSLAGVVGRRVASAPGFNYSAGMRAYAKRQQAWTPAALDAFIANPRQAVPGTRMAFAGQRDPARRKQIIDFLATLK